MRIWHRIDVTPEPFAYEIHRRELYADLGKNGKRKLVPLGELGQDVMHQQQVSKDSI